MNTRLLIIIYLLNSISPMSEELRKLFGLSSPVYTNPFLLSEHGILDYYKFMNLKFTDPAVINSLNDYKVKTNLNGRLDIKHLKKAHQEGKLDFGITAKPSFGSNKKQMELLKYANALSSDDSDSSDEVDNKVEIIDLDENQDLIKVLKDADNLNLSIGSVSTLNSSGISSNLGKQDLNISITDIFGDISEEDNINIIEHERNINLQKRKSLAEISDEDGFVEKKSFNKRKVKKGKSSEDNELFNGQGKIIFKQNNLKNLSESDEEINYNLTQKNNQEPSNIINLNKVEDEEKVFREVVIVEIMDCKDCLDDPDLVFFTENY